MGNIINIDNFRAYCRIENRIWKISDLLEDRFPVLDLRNMMFDDNYPLSWKNESYFNLAVNLTLEILKRWRAYRPKNPDKIIKKLTAAKDLHKLLLKFQKNVLKYRIKNTREIIRMDQDCYNKIIIIISKTVGDISSYKNDKKPNAPHKVK